MALDEAADAGGRRRRRRSEKPDAAPKRVAHYNRVRNTLPFAEPFSSDQVEAIHNASLRVLEELGVKVLLEEGRDILRGAGCKVDEDTLMVHFDRGLVEEAIKQAPSDFVMTAGARERDLHVGGREVIFGPGAGCPNVTDFDRGRRPGSYEAFVETTKLQQSFDVIQKLGPSSEPQDVPVNLRHYATMRAQLTLTDKIPWLYSRGPQQVAEGFEIMRLMRGLSEEEFLNTPCVSTVVNTNSPRQIDRPMSQGIIDFARAGQMNVITPFCLSGAMAPITIPGALTLSHAEALAGITLAQIVRPGAPVVYGAFSSNVDMKSGAPAFGTPEHLKTNFGAGQLARHVDLPWRSGGGTAASSPDVQADYETQLSVWGALLGGANLIYHSAGWLEGGLTFSYEKFITDIETLQTLAETMAPIPCAEDDIGFEAIAEVQPGGHFFAASQTMRRYSTQFYEPFVSDWSNFGQWTEAGEKSATDRANALWKKTLEEYEPPKVDEDRLAAVDEYIEQRKAAGGAPIMD
ncbi:MAG: trimethylamine methyltransferase family protein [Pseudomonadota bacterium]